MKLNDNTVLITGGGSGLGRRLAESFLALRNEVIIAGNVPEELHETIRFNPKMKSFLFEQGKADSIRDLAASVVREFPGLNLLINNAGIQRVENLLSGELETCEHTVEVNWLGPVRLTAALLPHLLVQPRAGIVNVSSTTAFLPGATIPTYCARKAALHSYTQSLRFQLRETSIDVIENIPPWLQTPLQGDRGMNPKAMPLDDFVREVMELLEASPSQPEIVVGQAMAWRYSEQGDYGKLFATYNEGFAAAQMMVGREETHHA